MEDNAVEKGHGYNLRSARPIEHDNPQVDRIPESPARDDDDVDRIPESPAHDNNNI